MKMGRILILVFILTCGLSAAARTFDYDFRSTPLSEALALLARQHPDVHVSFIYNELEGYRVTARIHTDDAYTALRQITDRQPVSLLRRGDRFYVEALQHGHLVYTGRVVAADGHPVAAATVMLLATKDSTVLTYGVADADGRFRIPCDHPGVIAKVTSVGYRPLYHKCAAAELGALTMHELPIPLSPVRIAASAAAAAPDRTTYRPTPRQKASAQTGLDLLGLLAIPSININPVDQAITTNTGAGVSVYVDGHPAGEGELDGLRIADVRYVEYLDFPTDPRFDGAEHVVNFVMQRYLYGGYAKASLSESVLTGLDSHVSAYARLTYKCMTYDLYAGVGNRGSHHSGTASEEQYRIIPDHLNYIDVERTQTLDRSQYRQNEYPVSFRAIYDSERMSVANTVGFTFADSPSAMSAGGVRFSANYGSDYTYISDNPVRSRLWSWRGDYLFAPWRDTHLTLRPYAALSRLTDNSYYYSSRLGLARVANLAREKHVRYGGSAGIHQTIARRHTIYVRAAYGLTRNDVDYSGTSPYFNKFSDTFAALTVGYGFRNAHWSASADAALQWETNRINTDSVKERYPLVNISVAYTPSAHHAVRAYLHHGANYPAASEKTPNVLRVNELMYMTGNMLLGLSRQLTLNLSYDWLPNGALVISAYGQYFRETNLYVPYFMQYDGGRALVRSLKSDADYRRLQAGLSVRWRLLDGNLQLDANPSVSFYGMKGEYDISRHPFALTASATCYLGAFYVRASYRSPFRTLQGNRAAWYRVPDFYGLQAGWHWRDLNVRLDCLNPFRSHWLCSTSTFASELYSGTTRQYGTDFHRRIALSVTYTIGYGKKVSRDNEVGQQAGASSAVLK